MIEEILVMITEVIPNKVVMIGEIKSITLSNGKRTGMVLESSVEGGVITLDQAIAEAQSSVGTAESPATMKSAGRRSVSKVDN